MMRRFKSSISTLVFTALIAFASSAAYGQGATSSLSGTVIDGSGGVIPGADVGAKNQATGVEFHTVTSDAGVFSIPSMPPGAYTVTVQLMGFKKAVIPDVTLNVSTQGTIKVTLEVGGLEEVVTVKGGADIVKTQETTIAATINTNQISNLPLVSRDAINAITMLPGVDTASTNRNSTVSGLPRGTINITIDGVNTQDNNNKTTEGLFSLISPRLDAIEEVTVSTATAGADAAGQGAVQIKFVTRSGTNKFTGSAYFFDRDPAWNSNYWFNNRDKTPDPVTGKAQKDNVKLREPGFRVGGPIMKDKAFFFLNFEEFRQPGSVTRQRTILTPTAMSGVFSYTVAGAVRTVNLLQLAAANGQTAVLDPTIAKVMSDITAATSTGGLKALTDPNELQYTLTNQTNQNRYYPTYRVDYNLTKNHRVNFSSNRQYYRSTPDSLNSADPSFPGFPIIGSQNSDRVTWATSLRSTLSPNVVNEVHGGYTNSFVTFFPEVSADAYKNASVANTGLFNLSFSNSTGSLATALSNPYPSRNTQGRENPTISVEDNLNWLKGTHSLSFGGTFTHIGLHSYTQNVVPSITLGLPTGDPAQPMFNAANFPGASATNITAAQQLYAVLTGHISAINASAVFDETCNCYAYDGNFVSRGQQHEFGVYAQDSWRARKNVTLNYGLRYEVQRPFVPRNGAFTTASDIYGVSGVGNLFKPGVLTGTKTAFVPLEQNKPTYNTDWNNFAPSIGVTWRPSARSGFLGRLIGGDEETVIRGAYAVSYNRNGIGDFSGQFSLNPGASITNVTRSTGNQNLGPLPLLFSNQAALGAPAFNATPTYPLFGTTSDSVNTFDPNIQVPYTHSFTFGVQRELTKSMAMEVRYVGNRNRAGWTSNVNFNESNINTNGFINEFRNAQANLQANIAAGRGNTFAYFGPNTGTSPLPVYLAYFSGVPTSQASDPTKYNSSNWSSTNFTNPLAIYQPVPLTPAGTSSTTGLAGDPTRQANAIAAGIPANYFRANPDLLGGAFEFINAINGKYDSLQIELRKRLSGGLQVAGNYVLANAYQDKIPSLQLPNELALTTGNTGGIHQALKFNWVYELPFGAGKRFANSSGWLDRVVGGWGFDGSARIQTGQILSFGNVRLVGMTDKDLQDAFKIRKDDANRIVYILPQDIIDNTIKAFSTLATSPTGYGALGAPTGRYFAPANGPDCIQALPGQCAPLEHFVTGPAFVRFDMSGSKRIAFTHGVNFEFRVDFLNAFNNINFLPVAAASASATMGQVNSAYTDSSNTQDPGGRLVQLGFRINW